MRFLYCLLPLFGSIALASELASADTCQCPQVRCSYKDATELCLCLNNQEAACATRCPDYTPAYQLCLAPPITTTIPPYPATSLQPTPKPKTCECPLVNCLAIWPGGCYCNNNAAQNCYDKCGGEPPKLKSCEEPPSLEPYPSPIADPYPSPIVEPYPPPIVEPYPPPSLEPYPSPIVEPLPSDPCECESIMCIQSWPESCYCANAAAEACNAKCGVKKELQVCPPQTSRSMTTSTRSRIVKHTLSSTEPPIPTPTETLLPPNTHQICGGFRIDLNQCQAGYVCITDPYTPGCGLPCDALGICVEDKLCGGFAGLACADERQVCHDDPRDDCDPTNGGADCGGLCVTPHRRMGSDDVER